MAPILRGWPSAIWVRVKNLKPAFLAKKPHFNFLNAHYFLIVGMTIVSSLLIYAAAGGQLDYMDALFFAGGANTQAGLNTIDVNLLNTFQQIVIYACAMVCNPITIHTCVVYLRLYWFEKRFQHVVREARLKRATLSKSKSSARTLINAEEGGVRGRNIRIMPNTGTRITNDGIALGAAKKNDRAPSQDSSPTINGDLMGTDADQEQRRAPEIKFAKTVTRSDGMGPDVMKAPPNPTSEDHLAFLQRQRNEDNDEVLRIPNPRDVEKGAQPRRISHGDANEPDDPDTPAGINATRPQNRHQTITIEEPTRPREARMTDEQTVNETPSTAKSKFPSFFSTAEKDKEDKDATRTRPVRRQTLDTLKKVFTREKEDIAPTPYLSWQPTMGRNSAFPGLTEEQREELGGIEYRSLKTLAIILFCYFWLFELLALLCLLPWIIRDKTYGSVVDQTGMSRVWWGFWTANSAFQDLGLTLTPDSMISFSSAVYPLLIMSFFIMIGNTAFPVMLRFIIYVMNIIVPTGSGLWEELRFLLDHPRRCFTLMFPSAATWWLFWVLVLLNGIDILIFIILDLNSAAVNDLPVGTRIVNGIFQAASTRTAGFSSVNIADLHPAVQVSYLVMMYISVFPIAISMRRTNVYEEDSLGMYKSRDDEEEDTHQSDLSYVGNHLRRQLSFDLWYVFVGFFILTIAEGSKLQSDDFSMFAVLFELISAYGTVGLSLGYSGTNASLSSQFSTVGKLVIVIMMIRGRHRGLPYGLDRAILLPSESLYAKEAEQAETRMRRHTIALGNLPDGGAMGRIRSKSADRGKGSVLRNMLAPGPPVPLEPSLSRARSVRKASVDYGASTGLGIDFAQANDDPDMPQITRHRTDFTPVRRSITTLTQ